MQMQKEIAFGAFKLDLANECLWKGARAISLRPKAFAVLKLLVEHPGLLVTKQQVLDTVWPGIFVGDAALKDNIRQLREALHDDARSPTYIETSHRRGYRFIGKISPDLPPKQDVSSTLVVPHAPPRVIIAPADKNRVLGRDAELALLRQWLEGALAGERQVVFITGEPGIGKSALVQAFVEQAGQLSEILVAQGQCLEHYGSGEAYLPLLDGFSRLCRTPQGPRVLSLLRQHAPTWLAQMPSAVPPEERDRLSRQPASTRERMLREMAELSEALSSASPLLLVLEDLHWSDYSTLDLLAYLARRHDPARLMVIGTYRPVDVILGDHPLKGVKRELQAHNLCRELPLEYLSEQAVAEYLSARFHGCQIPARLRRKIYRRTEGNPLFMVNLVEYLTDQEIIRREQTPSRLQVDYSRAEREVPTSLRQLIEKQLDRLTLDERTVLEGASVAGMECSTAAIAAGLEMPIDCVERLCEQLASRHQFLSPAWLALFPNGTTSVRHRFSHILYLEVPYRLISPARRSQIHQRVAERGIVLYGERNAEIAAELAMHFEQGRDWPNALKYLLQAAENAVARSAHHEASDLARRGLEILQSLPVTPEHVQQEIKLRMALGVSLTTIKGFASAEVENVFARGRELFWLQGPSPELFHMLWALGLYYHFGGELESSLEIAAQLLEMAEGLKDGYLFMEAHRYKGSVLVILGRSQEGLEHLDQAVRLYEVHGSRRGKVFITRDCKVVSDSFAARALWMLGQSDQAAQRMAKALAFARQLGHPPTLVEAGYSAAQIHVLRGEATLAYERASESLDLADAYGLEFWLPYGLVMQGWAEAELRDQKKGIEQMRHGLTAYQATGARLWCPFLLALLADQLAKAGRIEESLATLEKAIKQGEESGERLSLEALYRIRRRVAASAGHTR